MKVSVRVAHSRSCPHATKSAIESVDAACRRSGCSPSYYDFHRDAGRRVIKGPRVKDKKAALEAAARKQRDLDLGTLGITQAKRVTLPEWVGEFGKILDGKVSKGRMKERTRDEYMTSLRRAAEAIGHIDMRQIGEADLRRFDDSLGKVSDSSTSRHFRHLSVAFSAAVRDKVAGDNPVPAYLSNLGLKKPRHGKAPFDDAELARLWPGFKEVRGGAPVYRYAAEFSAESGLRLGEIVALDWPAVSLSEKTVRVDWTYTAQYGLVAPKGGKRRTVHLTNEALAVLEAWVGVVASSDRGPVFPDPGNGGRLSGRNMLRHLDAAMKKAAIPKDHPSMVDDQTGAALKRSFHSLRYSTSNLMQRRGYHPRFIMQTLGHSSEVLTFGVYGQWTGDQLAAEAAEPTYARATAE